MNNFIFETGTKFILGTGCVKEYLASFLQGYGPSVLVVTDRNGEALWNHPWDEAAAILHREKKTVVEFTVLSPCPSEEAVRQAAKLCRERQVDLILGVGGSGVLDCCKAVSLAAVCRGDLWRDFWARPGVVDVPPLPVGLVSTSVETGAVNGAAGLLHEGQCIWRDYPACDPRFALLDPACTRTLSREHIAAQGFSALEGAMEQYLDPVEGTGAACDLMEVLMRKMVRDLRACCQDLEDESSRSDLMWENALWGSRFFQLGRQSSFPALPVRELALRFAAETEGDYPGMLSVLFLDLCRREAGRHPGRMAQLARRVWELPGEGKPEDRLALEGAGALEALLQALDLPTETEQLDRSAQMWLKQAGGQNLMVYTA